ncbi:MAG TPA: nucleotidyltransferase domain-containing protein [Chroococcales cyanobacterium]
MRKIQAIFAQYPQITEVVLYGSRAKGNFRPGSDLDLTIKGGLTLSQLLKIEDQLDELLLPYRIDLSLFDQIEDPDLREHIARVGLVFYQPEP